MKKHMLLLPVFMILLVPATVPADAQVPQSMSYQGYATTLTGAPIADGQYTFTFALYTGETTGSPLWREVHQNVTVKRGLFNVVFGAGNPPVPLSIAFDAQYYLGITLGTNPEMMPRVRLTPGAYSHRAREADGVKNGSIRDEDIAADAAIGAMKLDPALLLPGEIKAGTGIDVTSSGGGVTISLGSLALAGDVSGPLGANKIAPNAVTRENIAPDVISSINNVTNDAGNINLVAGKGLAIAPNPTARTITISAPNMVSGDGQSKYVPVWMNDSTIGVSDLYQTAGGSYGFGMTSPMFKVDVNGDVRVSDIVYASAFEASGRVGGMGTPATGGYYKNNCVYGWLHATSSGGITDAFGVTSVSRSATGTYLITFRKSLQGRAISVTPHNGISIILAQVTGIADNSCTVKTYSLPLAGGAPTLTDTAFFVTVVGEP